MADHSLSAILRRLGRQAAADGPEAISDAELLRRYAAQRDAAAFELLVWRHGATVWGACRRLLSSPHDAEDAFQAVFMVLARKAGAIRQGECLGGWLHRVAMRVSRRAQARAMKAGNRERSIQSPEFAVDDTPAEWSEIGPVVDQEIDRLPAKQRAAFVLCHLQGHTCDEAARRLGCAKGTILSRLARARDRLKDRLTRRGITLSSAAFASLASGMTPSAARIELTMQSALSLPAKLTAAAAPASAAILSQEVLRAMFIGKLKIACCAAIVLLGIGAFGWREMTPGADNGEKSFGLTDKELFAAPKEQADPDEPKAASEPKKGGQNERRYSVEFRDMPWRKVIEWYADISGLTIAASEPPPAGAFTFVPPKIDGKPRKYTASEILDVVNEALKPKGFVLIRRDQSLVVSLLPNDDPKAKNKKLIEELRAALDRASVAEKQARAERDRAELERRKAEAERDELKKQLDELRKELLKLKELRKK